MSKRRGSRDSERSSHSPMLNLFFPLRYKTELCRSYNESGTCRFAEMCTFAHGPSELRSVPRHPKYKTEFCKNYHKNGICVYGSRCHFIHGMNDIIVVRSNALRRSHSSSSSESSTASPDIFSSNYEECFSFDSADCAEYCDLFKMALDLTCSLEPSNSQLLSLFVDHNRVYSDCLNRNLSVFNNF